MEVVLRTRLLERTAKVWVQKEVAEVFLVGEGEPAKYKLIAFQVYATSKLWNTYVTEPPKNSIRGKLLVPRYWAEATNDEFR